MQLPILGLDLFVNFCHLVPICQADGVYNGAIIAIRVLIFDEWFIHTHTYSSSTSAWSNIKQCEWCHYTGTVILHFDLLNL